MSDDARSAENQPHYTVMSREEEKQMHERIKSAIPAQPVPFEDLPWYSGSSLYILGQDARDIVNAAMHGVSSYGNPSEPEDYMQSILDIRETAIAAIDDHNARISKMQAEQEEETRDYGLLR